ncbi:MAG TPA: histidine kinase [Terriglobia bacterium]|nr:histidine kinase [Terriglobia bacterium]
MGFTVAYRGTVYRTPLALSEASRRERVLSSARFFVALYSLVAIRFDRGIAGSYALAAHLLLLFYVIHSLITLILVRVYQDRGPSFLLSIQAGDVLWPALLSLFTGGPNSPFFLLYAFALLAAAYRGSLRETLATALSSALILLSEAALVTSSLGYRWRLLYGQFGFTSFITEIMSLLMLGGLLGYLADREKHLPGETSAVKSILQNADPEASIDETLEGVLRAILRLFEGKRVALALSDLATSRGFVWECGAAEIGQEGLFQFAELEASQWGQYFFPLPGSSWCLQKSQREERYRLLALDDEGRRLEKVSCPLAGNLLSGHLFRSLLGVTFRLGNEWSGRVFLFDVRHKTNLESDLRFFKELIGEVAPAVHSVYLLRRLRSRSRTIERARIARDLHDGVIQSLIALEMQVEVLRRQCAGTCLGAAESIESVRNLLRQEISNLRELMQQLRLDEAAPPQILPCVAEIVDKFRRETGINASFASELEAAALPPRVSREVAQIVREALANVRKHSGAQNVQVRLASSQDDLWRLVIEDDGQGFEFSGRLSQTELDAACKGPRVIKERVHSIKGELAVESHPSQGARLEIRFAPKAHG